MKINSGTNLTLDIKTIIIVCSFVITISEKEFELKDELIRTTIMSNAERLEKIEKKIDKIDERLYNLNN